MFINIRFIGLQPIKPRKPYWLAVLLEMIFLNSMPVAARDVKSIDLMQHADSKHIVMTTSIYLQSYKTATLFSTRNNSFCFNSESRLSQIFLLGR